jgi:hypothetical protein
LRITDGQLAAAAHSLPVAEGGVLVKLTRIRRVKVAVFFTQNPRVEGCPRPNPSAGGPTVVGRLCPGASSAAESESLRGSQISSSWAAFPRRLKPCRNRTHPQSQARTASRRRPVEAWAARVGAHRDRPGSAAPLPADRHRGLAGESIGDRHAVRFERPPSEQPVGLNNTWIPQALAQFASEYPDVNLSVQVTSRWIDASEGAIRCHHPCWPHSPMNNYPPGGWRISAWPSTRVRPTTRARYAARSDGPAET